MSSFMQPQVFQANYFEVNTSHGTEIVMCDDCRRTMNVHVDALLNHLSGTPNDPEEMCEAQSGWVARLAAPGYLDCTDYTIHDSEEEAYSYLEEYHG